MCEKYRAVFAPYISLAIQALVRGGLASEWTYNSSGNCSFFLGVPFCFLLLSKAAFAVAHSFSHMTEIINLILGCILFGIPPQGLNDLAAAASSYEISYCNIFADGETFTFHGQ